MFIFYLFAVITRPYSRRKVMELAVVLELYTKEEVVRPASSLLNVVEDFQSLDLFGGRPIVVHPTLEVRGPARGGDAVNEDSRCSADQFIFHIVQYL